MNENNIKMNNLAILNFNSFKKLKYLPECKNSEINEIPNNIFSIHEIDLIIILFISLIFKDININIRKKINKINISDVINILKLIIIG